MYLVHGIRRLFFSQLFVRPPQTPILLFRISFPWGWSWSLSPVQCHEPHSITRHISHSCLSCLSKLALHLPFLIFTCSPPNLYKQGLFLWMAMLSHQRGLSCPIYLLLLLLSRFSRVWLCNPIDGSPPGSVIPGFLQARTLELGAISFSNLSNEGYFTMAILSVILLHSSFFI